MPKGSFYVGNTADGCPEIEDSSVDLIITSPPYFKRDGYTDDLMHALGGVFARVLKPGGRAYVIFGQIKEKLDRPYDAQTQIILGGGNDLAPAQTIVWVKSIAVGDWIEQCPDCDHKFRTETVSRGHFQPINSKHLLNYCWEYIIGFIKKPEKAAHPLNRKAKGVGVAYADKSNIKRWKSAADALHCPGDVWFVQPEPTFDPWLACFLDTDGSCYVRKQKLKSNRYSCRVVVELCNSNLDILNRAKDLIGAGALRTRPVAKGALGKKDSSALTLVGPEAAKFLARVYPHLIIKRRQARLGMHLQSQMAANSSKKGKQNQKLSEDQETLRLKIADEMSRLNKGEDVDIGWCPEPTRVVTPGDALYIPYETTGATVKKIHRHEFPLELATKLITMSGIPLGSTVFDPFVGGGTTCYAANACGMDSAGYDMSEAAITVLRKTWGPGISKLSEQQGAADNEQ